jgi:glycosyltransferase involved in cell wall biosynthesis
MTARLAVVVSGFPRTSETFAVGELVSLARAGMLTRLYATKAGDGAPAQPGVDELLPLLHVLPPGDADEQAAALVADLAAGSAAGSGTGFRAGAVDGAVDGLHGYFAHRPTEVAAKAAALLDVGYSFSAHALDARKVPDVELARRARAAAGVVACNTDVRQHVDVPGARVRLLPHGVDVRRFGPRPRPQDDGRLHVLAVGRLVEKKGFDTLVVAAGLLPDRFVFRIVGTGAERERLERLVARHGLTGRVELVGRRSHEELPDEYAWADVVVVPSVVDQDGDRDGLPNVALEAMACCRPIVASDVSALGQVVRAAGSGLVVRPGDSPALAGALMALAAQPRLRAHLAVRGRRHVQNRYGLDQCTSRLVRHLDTLHARRAESVDA